MSGTDPSSFLVRILKDPERPRLPFGSGFLVSNRHIITCAHVVCDALKLPKYFTKKTAYPIILDFPLIDHQPTCIAEVLKWIPCRKDPTIGEPEDIAVLKLAKDQSLPPQARPATLLTLYDFSDLKVKMCGFPEGEDNGDYINGKTMGKIGTGWVQFNPELGSRSVDHGFSGTPVWNFEGQVIGMVTSKSDREGKISGYMIPTSTLIKEFPDILPPQNIIPLPTNPELETQIHAYCEKAKSLYEKLPLMGFKTQLRVRILIEDIYIPLRVMVDRRVTGDACFADADDAEERLREYRCEEISVPEAFNVAEKIGRRGIVILGDPGSGKTTHLKRVFLWCMEGGFKKLGLPFDMIPVFLPLRELQNLKASLDDFIQEQLNQPHLDTPEGFGKALLKRGNLLFLLDGLDEVSDTQERVKVSRWINTALSIHKNCWFVVTCRFAGYTQKARLSEDFLEMHMRPLTTEQAEAFIRNWYRLVETGLSTGPEQALMDAEKNAENLIKRLKQKEYRSARVFTMTRNPLLLTNLCLVHKDRGGELPTRRSRLYEECIQVLLEYWKESIGLKSKVDADTGSQVLQPAAYWLHTKKDRVRATADELAPVMEPALKKVGWSHGSAKDFMKIVRDESGLLTGWSDDQYGFMHLGFQEYLAALEIQNLAYRDSKVLKQLAKNFSNSWWQEVILLLLAQKNPCLFKEFITEVIKQDSFITGSNLIDICIEESAETTVDPFLELLKIKPGKNRNLWERQLLALKIAERLEEKSLELILDQIREHPYEPIRQWIQERFKQAQQDVIRPEPSGYELVLIKGGTFMMGSDERDVEKPVHEVTVPDFYMGRYLVTNEEYGRFIEATGYQEPEYWGDRKYNQLRQPVVGVSWYDAKEFAKWAGLQLPSEAQWEFSCRAGTTTHYYTGDSEDDLNRAGWYSKNTGDKPHPVGEKEPNGFGLYDMHGNVWEWCEDHWHDNYKKAPDDGSAWVYKRKKAFRVIRGGSWRGDVGDCRAANRGWIIAVYRIDDYGFRLVRLPGQRSEPGR